MELPKSQKKTARLLINEGLQRECRLHLQKVYNFNRHIAFRYDCMSGSRYFMTITDLFCSGILTQKDINLFSEEVQQAILRIKQNFEE